MWALHRMSARAFIRSAFTRLLPIRKPDLVTPPPPDFGVGLTALSPSAGRGGLLAPLARAGHPKHWRLYRHYMLAQPSTPSNKAMDRYSISRPLRFSGGLGTAHSRITGALLRTLDFLPFTVKFRILAPELCIRQPLITCECHHLQVNLLEFFILNRVRIVLTGLRHCSTPF